MRKFYMVYKILIMFNFIVNLIWLAYERPIYIYTINFLISMILLLIILFVKGKRQIRLLLYIEPVRLIYEPFVVYAKYTSLGFSLLSILIGVVFIVFLYDLKNQFDYI